MSTEADREVQDLIERLRNRKPSPPEPIEYHEVADVDWRWNRELSEEAREIKKPAPPRRARGAGKSPLNAK